ncbi:type II toxin-antitoxin system Phd/YefM family antitoxin [Vibrio sp. 10N.261.46.A3]|uniref:type II toxin-antitoxin system Phd/YefM family antitoxin n=1 Tax=Vibrio sp. 10N.261.46.A3 TaxID=3229658 RepID=UPI00355240EE
MQVMTYTEVRSNLKSVCDKVIDDCDSVTIHRRDGDNVVLISESEFNSWKETMYLMSNPINANHLLESISQIERGEKHSTTLSHLLGEDE